MLILLCTWIAALSASPRDTFDVVVVGGGASGTAAALTAARLGAVTGLLEEGPWLGGMITSAGVSAFDGNHRIAGGIFREFRDSLYRWYGGPKAVETGWVSNTLFEPHVGNRIFQNMVRNEPSLTVWQGTSCQSALWQDSVWFLRITGADGDARQVVTRSLIDATELGDVVASLGIPADVGMEGGGATGEWFAPETANDIVQDLTWVAILQSFPEGNRHLIPHPEGYNPDLFRCACDTRDPSTSGSPLIDCKKMLEYGRLPNGKYMINWPNCGNDIYLNVLTATPEERAAALQEAKQKTRAFVYFLQQELGFTHLGLAETEYPTVDKLPLIPYHRESRRIHGKVRLLVNHILGPFDQNPPLYRTGIAVGDYPIDHHHKQNPNTPAIDFINIKAPSYNIPLGSLIPANGIPIIVAEKSISVSNIVNGTTRLQPVVLGIGQAAGTLAALAAKLRKRPENISVRDVQISLLQQGAYILPYIDVPPDDSNFLPIQRIGATGILRGKGIPYKWANQTWFYPDSICKMEALLPGWMEAYPSTIVSPSQSEGAVTIEKLAALLTYAENGLTIPRCTAVLREHLPSVAWTDVSELTRRQVALLIDTLAAPFDREITLEGQFLQR